MEERYETAYVHTKESSAKDCIRKLAITLGLTSNARLKIVDYLLKNLGLNDNVLEATIRELSCSTGVCTNTVTRTLQILEQNNIITRRTGTIILNRDMLYRYDDSVDKTMSDPYRLNIEIQTTRAEKEHSLSYGDHKNRKECEAREKEFQERERETAFAILAQKKNAEILRGRNKELDERERALNKREAALIEEEKKLKTWEKRLDELLGLQRSDEKTTPMFSLS